jgi:sacsin
MDEYFNEARISLLFLRRIKSIDFRIHEETNFSWSVIRKRPLDEDAKSFSELLICSFAKTVEASTLITGKDHWWVAIEDLLPHAGRLPHSMRRVMKNIECGIAALISSKSDTNRGIIAPEAIQSRMFSTLPLPMSSELPIHIHATFSLSGDRQSISIAEDGPEAHGSEWNRYLLEDALPNLYLAFLDDIGTQVRQRVFSFWPPGQTPKGSVSELLCTSFWKKLPQSSRRLFPKAEPNTGLPQRRAAELFDINQAVFDFLPQNHSEVLTPLLMSLEVKLVRNIPAEVAKNLKTFPEVKSVTGQLLRRLLKSEGAKTYLLKEIGKNPQILEVLFSRVISAGTDLEDLDGCHLLPLAGGGLATLKYVNASMATSPTSYYVVSEKELQLFQFASRYLVLSTTARKLESVINSAKFNVGKLQLYDLRKLLELKPSSLTPNPEGDKWLGEFWEFWNKHTDSSLPWLTVDDLNIPIFRARRSGVDSYATPVQFHEYPAVVEPSVIQHQKLCDKTPGLYQFDPKFMPTSLRDSEVSLSKNVSFCKFVRAMRKLAGPTWTKNFVEAHLDIAQVKVLFLYQLLMLIFYSQEILTSKQ